jgi:SagB-type dehydrogenase family enzyme
LSLPRHILERVERVYSYHQRTKLLAMGPRVGVPPDPDYAPAGFRIFANAPKVSLPTTLLDAPVGMLSLLSTGQDALPESLRAPPQDAKTLASWLYYAAGETKRVVGKSVTYARSFPDADANLPVEIYVAVFGVEGVEAGLYHFCPREFALRRLREGVGALMQLKKGRPDLEFLKTVPAVILVAANYWRAVHRFGGRGYRTLLLDVGQMVQNLVVAGAGLGAQTVTRLRMNDSTLRELIGCPLEEPLATAESVLAMVAWADPAVAPIRIPPGTAAEPMPVIARPELSLKVSTDPALAEPLLVHQDCIAPGVAVREIRPPLTELSPLPGTYPASDVRAERDTRGGLPVRQALMQRRPKAALTRHAIARSDLLSINRVTFRGGSFFPMFPDGAHVALVRPFWIVQDVVGMEGGIWYYHPPTDAWHALNRGEYRREAKYIAGDRASFGDAAAVCVMVGNLHLLMTQGGPDAYRLAHLEAGIATQRLYLAATSLNVGCLATQEFYDEDARHFLGLAKTGWEVLTIVALGRFGTPMPPPLQQKSAARPTLGMPKT